MKTLLILFFSCISFASIGQHDYLVGYGQVWGFLKYFHPEPGKSDWDNTLLNDFDGLMACQSNEEFNKIIATLIERCGSFEGEKRIIADSLIFSESYEWLDNTLIAPENITYLTELLQNKPKFKNKYISATPVGRPDIKNEPDYGEYTHNPAIQFLAITRYWNVINYFCPNRDIIPENWTQVYQDHVMEFISAKTYEEYYFAVRKLTTKIRDGHGFIRAVNDPLLNYKYAPFFCMSFTDGYYVNVVFQDSLESVNLKRMDRLVSINGTPVEDKIKEVGTYLSTSNDYFLSQATHYLRITDQDSVTLTVERDGKLITNTYPTIDRKDLMSRYKRKSPPPKPPYAFRKDSISGKEYCYLDLGKLKRSDIKGKFKRKLLSMDQIIIDVRNYPNWTLIKLSDLLIKGRRKFAKFIAMDFDYPGAYMWTESQTIGNKKKGYEGNIYVLVDYNTMSQAEYTVMAFQQHPNAAVIGGQTAGADGNICQIPLPFGIKSVYSGLGVFYPDRTPTQQVGVARDYEVEQSSEFLNGHDSILEKALELIRSK